MTTLMPIVHNNKMVFCIVMHGNGLERLTKNDPAVVPSEDLTACVAGSPLALQDIEVLICYEPDQQAFKTKCAELGSKKAILQYLCRGWQNLEGERPDNGETTKEGL